MGDFIFRINVFFLPEKDTTGDMDLDGELFIINLFSYLIKYVLDSKTKSRCKHTQNKINHTLVLLICLLKSRGEHPDTETLNRRGAETDKETFSSEDDLILAI